MPTATLETIAVRKEYPGTVALDDVSLKFEGGKIHALIGKNGAGKSTLVKLFAGAIQPTDGRILVNGNDVHFRSPKDALRQGIATVYQELSLIPELTVAENVLLGRLPRRPSLGGVLIDWPCVFARAKEVLDNLHVDLDVRARAGKLGVAQQQVVEIAKAMSYNPSVLMLDEPTSALAAHETEQLFGLLRQLTSRGVVLLYITHRLHEINQIADSITVLRNGKLIGTIGVREATPALVVSMMCGEVLQKVRPADIVFRREPAMVVQNLTRGSQFRNINFTLRKGEILGIAGLLGSGRTELLRSLFGADKPDSGSIVIEGKEIHPENPEQMKRLGIALTPEDRKQEGLVQLLSTRVNMCLASLNRISSAGFLTRARERKVVTRRIEEVDIKAPDIEAPVSSLSGGNQQKVVLGKWLNTEPRVMLLDEPTRGIDIQAKQQMFQLMWEMSRRGIASIVVSSELEELLDVCHRILIMKKGRITGEVVPAETPLEKLFALCMEENPS